MLRAVHLGAAVLASIGVACASAVDVRIDQRKDLAGYCTWNFLSLEDGSVRAPVSDARELDARLARTVEAALLRLGFVRVMSQPDFHVSYFLEVRRQSVIVTETPAVEFLSSLHHSQSYEVQISERRTEAYEIGNLAILVSDPDAQGVIWRGGFQGRFRGTVYPHLRQAVSSLLERLPPPTAARGARPDEGASVRADPAGGCGPRI